MRDLLFNRIVLLSHKDCKFVMMIVIAGTKYRKRPTGEPSREATYCQNCGYFSHFRSFEVRNWLTLFFIPVFPIGKSKRVLLCGRCEGGSSPFNSF